MDDQEVLPAICRYDFVKAFSSTYQHMMPFSRVDVHCCNFVALVDDPTAVDGPLPIGLIPSH